MNNQQLVMRYAQLAAIQERGQSRGVSLPPEQINEMRRIEAQAQGIFTPQEMVQVNATVNSLKAQAHHTLDALDNEKLQKRVDFGQHELSVNATGLTPLQRKLAREGKPYPVKGSGRFNEKSMDQWAKGNTKHLGKELSYKQLNEVSDRYQELKNARGPEAASNYIQKQFGDKAKMAEQFVSQYEDSGMALRAGITEKRAERDGYAPDRMVTPNDADVLRADIESAWAGSDNPEDKAAYVSDELGSIYIDEDSRRGDIARAFAQTDYQEREERLENFQIDTPHNYNLDELSESMEATNG